MLRLTECYVTTSLNPARHNFNDTGTDSDRDPDTDSEGAAEPQRLAARATEAIMLSATWPNATWRQTPASCLPVA